MRYVFLVDESGDQGLKKVRESVSDRGASPYLTLGGVLIPETHIEATLNCLNDLSSRLGKNLHCADLNHFQTAAFAREAASIKMLAFGVISKKSTLGDYLDGTPDEDIAQDYYNKCSHYLLELLGKFMSHHDVKSEDVSIVFERKNHDYQRLRSYISAIRKSPKDRRAAFLQSIDPFGITDRSKDEEPLLALADLVAFATFQSVNESQRNYGLPEERYMRELKKRFWRCPDTGQVAHFGLKYIKGPVTMGLSGQTMSFAMKAYQKKDS